MLPLNGNVVHLSLNSLIFNAFQVGSYKITATIEKDIIQQLTLNQEKNDFITKGQWKYYKLDATTNAKVIFRLLSLSGVGQVERSLSNRLDSQYLHHMKCYPNLLIHIYHNHQN
jgi:hypothetical protein